jgi:hypothetical protein
MMVEKKKRTDKRLSLDPLTFEEALEGLLQVGPPPKEKPEPKERPRRKQDQEPKEGR